MFSVSAYFTELMCMYAQRAQHHYSLFTGNFDFFFCSGFPICWQCAKLELYLYFYAKKKVACNCTVAFSRSYLCPKSNHIIQVCGSGRFSTRITKIDRSQAQKHSSTWFLFRFSFFVGAGKKRAKMTPFTFRKSICSTELLVVHSTQRSVYYSIQNVNWNVYKVCGQYPVNIYMFHSWFHNEISVP